MQDSAHGHRDDVTHTDLVLLHHEASIKNTEQLESSYN